MRLKNIPRADSVVHQSPFVVQDPENHRGAWGEIFGNHNPIRLEVGTGKGHFLLTLAEQNPDINYVGLEKYSSALLRGVEVQNEKKLPNLRFIRGDAELLTEYFGPGEVDRIYLNFSDPWPKDRHAKRRLPSRYFLARYDVILKDGGQIEFKTDNRPLFDFALEEAQPGGFEVIACTFDLHHDPVMNEGNVMTEYEKKFSQLGTPICKYILKRKEGFDPKERSRMQKEVIVGAKQKATAIQSWEEEERGTAPEEAPSSVYDFESLCTHR